MTHPMSEQLQKRLNELRREMQTGQDRRRDLDDKIRQLDETLVRISGAIQVLEEILAEDAP